MRRVNRCGMWLWLFYGMFKKAFMFLKATFIVVIVLQCKLCMLVCFHRLRFNEWFISSLSFNILKKAMFSCKGNFTFFFFFYTNNFSLVLIYCNHCISIHQCQIYFRKRTCSCCKWNIFPIFFSSFHKLYRTLLKKINSSTQKLDYLFIFDHCAQIPQGGTNDSNLHDCNGTQIAWSNFLHGTKIKYQCSIKGARRV